MTHEHRCECGKVIECEESTCDGFPEIICGSCLVATLPPITKEEVKSG